MLFYRNSPTRQPDASPTEYARANKELRKLTSSLHLIHELRSKQKEIDGLKSLIAECVDEKDMLKMAYEELDQAVEEEKRLQMLLLKSLLPKDDADERDSILEVLEAKKLPYLQWRYSKCMKGTHRRRDGNLKLFI